MSLIHIKGGRIVDPANNIDKVSDLCIKGGKIYSLEAPTEKADKVIDASGLVVMPGFVDLNCHLREPGFESRETILTGSMAGAAGGYTTLCAMPNTDPVTDNEIVATYVKYKAEKEAVIRVLPVGAITKGKCGEELADIGRMAKAGVCALSEGDRTVQNAALMKTALKYSKMFDLPVLAYSVDTDLAGKGSMNAGDAAALLGLKGISADSEEVMVSRDMILAGSTKARLHLCHISTSGSVTLIKQAKERGVNVTADVTPHHFSLSDEDIVDYDANYKVNPPLRTKEDIVAIKEGLKNNIIEVIATDHAPRHIDEKNCEFEKAENGIVGLETAFALSFTNLVDKNVITLSELVKKMSLNPAKIINSDLGTLSVGACADVTIADIEKDFVFDKTRSFSKSRNTPFDGKTLKGKILYTISRGNVVFEKGSIKGECK